MDKVASNVQIQIEDVNFVTPTEEELTMINNMEVLKLQKNLGVLLLKLFAVCFLIGLGSLTLAQCKIRYKP